MEWGIGQWGRKVKQRWCVEREERNIVRKENMEGKDRVGQALERGRIRREKIRKEGRCKIWEER